ncbi:MAG: hypothetical protein HFE73_07330 [Firmicutes bacterium]|jgi:hypothetical protein|nr:hypothetical protein [Bacillota bacterium]
MNVNDKLIRDIAGQLGLGGSPAISPKEIQRLEGKSDAELEREIINLREQLKAKGIPPQKQVAMLRSIMPMMDAKQKARLNKIIGLIER